MPARAPSRPTSRTRTRRRTPRNGAERVASAALREAAMSARAKVFAIRCQGRDSRRRRGSVATRCSVTSTRCRKPGGGSCVHLQKARVIADLSCGPAPSRCARGQRRHGVPAHRH
jgi:hypothetical protein